MRIDFESTLAALPGHVYWKDKDLIFLGCNNKLAKFFGLKSRYDIVGKTAWDFALPEEAENIEAHDQAAIDAGHEITAEMEYTLPDGKKAIFLVRKLPMRDVEGNIIGIVGIAFDVTLQKRAEEMARLNQFYQEKVEAYKSVAGCIAHELRTPLATVKMGVQGIENYLPKIIQHYEAYAARNPDEKLDISARKISQLLIASQNIVKEIDAANICIDLLLTNVEQKSDVRYNTQLTTIAECVDSAVKRYPFARGEKPLVTVKSENNFSIMAEPEIVVHVLMNLIKNALYAIKAAGKGEITLWYELHDKYNELHFKDTALGMTQAQVDTVFKAFYSSKHFGAGLGLTFCRLAMQNLQGNIACRAQEGQYTEFILYFPHPPQQRKSSKLKGKR